MQGCFATEIFIKGDVPRVKIGQLLIFPQLSIWRVFGSIPATFSYFGWNTIEENCQKERILLDWNL